MNMIAYFFIATLCAVMAFLFEWGKVVALIVYPVLFVWLYIREVFYPHLCLLFYRMEQNESRSNFYMVRVGLVVLIVSLVLLCVFVPQKFILVRGFYIAFLLMAYVYPIVQYVVRRVAFYKEVKALCKNKNHRLKTNVLLFLIGRTLYIESPTQVFSVHAMDAVYPMTRIQIVTGDAYTVQKVNFLLAEEIDRLEQQMQEKPNAVASFMCSRRVKKRKMHPEEADVKLWVFSPSVLWRQMSSETRLKNGDVCHGYTLYDETTFLSGSW